MTRARYCLNKKKTAKYSRFPSRTDSRDAQRGTEMELGKLPFAATVKDTAKWSGISRSRLYVLLGRGEIEGKKVGVTTLVLLASVARYIESRPSARGNGIRPLYEGGE
jgi:hypothetical protein